MTQSRRIAVTKAADYTDAADLNPEGFLIRAFREIRGPCS